MEQVFAETIRALIDGWMAYGLEPYVTLVAALALAARAAFLLLFREKR